MVGDDDLLTWYQGVITGRVEVEVRVGRWCILCQVMGDMVDIDWAVGITTMYCLICRVKLWDLAWINFIK